MVAAVEKDSEVVVEVVVVVEEVDGLLRGEGDEWKVGGRLAGVSAPEGLLTCSTEINSSCFLSHIKMWNSTKP